jgi:hypothetical protein
MGGRRPPPTPSASTWLAVGILGILLFAVGIWEPAWAGLPAGPYIEVALAAVGGSLAVVGWTYFGRARPRPVRLEDLADGKTVAVLDFRPSRSRPSPGGGSAGQPIPPPDPKEHP